MAKKDKIVVEGKKVSKEEIEANTKKAARDMFTEYGPFLILLAFIIVIRVFIASPFRVQGTSMVPTLKNNDYMLLYKLKKNVKGINRFDIVVVDSSQGAIIKRVIGLPGEFIKYEVKEEDGVSKGILYVNGMVVDESFFLPNEYTSATCHRSTDICNEGIQLKDDEYFVMGDNRAVSMDSRMLGAFSKKQIRGIADLRLFPFKSFGSVKASK